jgi:hypothetical protein
MIQMFFDRRSTNSWLRGPCVRHRLTYGYETMIYTVNKDVAVECAGRSWNVTSGGSTQ